MNNHELGIDFVIMWVDPNDIEWQRKKAKYSTRKNEDDSIARYRDWGLLKYWFRGVEKFAPWVRKVFFVTDGQKPAWLNDSYERLVCVDHRDYIDEKYLPVFNSCAIEIGLHKISGLSEKFVLFNDDFFIINHIKEDYYFNQGLPVDIAGFTRAISQPTEQSSTFHWHMYNDYCLLNRRFSKKEVLKKNWKQWFKLSYGKDLLRTLLNCNREKFDGIINQHLSAPYLKQDFEKCWAEYYDDLVAVYNNRFRSNKDINQYIFRFFRMCEGTFFPRAVKGKYIGLKNDKDVDKAVKIICKQKAPELCINDCWEEGDYTNAKERIIEAFEKILPTKCEYEI